MPTVSKEVTAWLHSHYRVLITDRGFKVVTKGSGNEVVKKRSWGQVLHWARDQRAKALSIKVPQA